MAYYRMAMRVGNRGQNLWPLCFKLGVAAITYRPLQDTDLSQHPHKSPRALWSKLKGPQIGSLCRVAYDMKESDVIFVKLGPKIVGRGVVKGPYIFDHLNRIVDENGLHWPHQVPVEWDNNFVAVDILLGAEQLTVRRLSQGDVDKIEKEQNVKLEKIEVQEGEAFRAEADFRARNRDLINTKKQHSDYTCEVCGFRFLDFYGDMGREYIVAHHLNPIASGSRTSTLDDIALVCANCHAMIHTKTQPFSISEMRKAVAANSGKRT